MNEFPNGIKHFIVGIASIEASFPVDDKGVPHVCCAHCEFYSKGTSRCALNHGVCDFPEKYVGRDCPLRFGESY